MADDATRKAAPTPRNPAPEPVRKAITVPWGVEAAFRRFTAELASWWPLRSHSIGQENAASCVFEGHVGGKIYELSRDGRRAEWGTVLQWSPPNHVEFTWHPGQDVTQATRVDLRFTATADGTRLELTHTGWENLGAEGKKLRRAYHLGWGYVLLHWAERKRASTVVLLDVIIALTKLAGRLRRGTAVTPAASKASPSG